MEYSPGGIVKFVVLFDINIGAPLDCRTGCADDENHLCMHRFGSDVCVHAAARRYLLAHPGLSDLGVIRHFTKVALACEGGVPHDVRWVIVTRDVSFWRAARHAYQSTRGRERRIFFFKKDAEDAVIARFPEHHSVRVEVAVLRSRKYGVGRIADIRCAIDRLSKLRA